jgi:hypothetical protein
MLKKQRTTLNTLTQNLSLLKISQCGFSFTSRLVGSNTMVKIEKLKKKKNPKYGFNKKLFNKEAGVLRQLPMQLY